MGLYPIITDLAALESSIYTILAVTNDNAIKSHSGIDIDIGSVTEAQSAVVLACLALGCQFAEIDAAGRQAISQDLVNRSNTCLQEGHCTLRPSVEVVQALLLIGLAQQNLEQSDSAWVLLGLTHRIAQNLDLDNLQPDSEDGGAGRKVHHLWRAILWQDVLLSIRYDRQPLQYNTKSRGESVGSNLSYFDAMHEVCVITAELLQEPKLSLNDSKQRIQMLRRLEEIRSRGCPHLRSGKMNRTFQQRSEYLLLNLHADFLAAEICRPGFSSRPVYDHHRMFREQGIKHVRQCLQAFLNLYQFSRFPLRSWSVTQAAVSTSLLLAMHLPQLRDESVVMLLRRVSEALWTDTSPPLNPSEVRGKCVGLSVTRMKASKLLAYVLDEGSEGGVTFPAGESTPVVSTEMKDIWAATHDLGEWPNEFSLFDPNFTASMLDFELASDWLGDVA